MWNDKKAPEYNMYGNRKINIVMARLRMKCSLLKADLQAMNIIEDATCDCGHPKEDLHHYLFECTLFTNERAILNDPNLNVPRDANVFIRGEPGSPQKNRLLFQAVAGYIKETKRFD